ncbi:hypothetical protein QM467_15780 [Rhodoblastus sp. 17X3]|uniref:hypothetical protein n=1 Tax=Rhodoblastus sp. 17X3 TaxID=3047026 RepID=UPI0024B7851D|nr:hypothetical protein [Rhodoblastus sp. 17X3]MDI9849516.1 hypothetical protein [Rhodoblastus sp. 17X3]
MLSAILRGKSRRIPDSVTPGASLKSVFKSSEDLLTATVFERLSYLPGEILWQILCETFKPPLLQSRKVATLEELEFWPYWNKANETLKKDVEPDVVMRFSIGDPAKCVTLIIECKLGGAQHPNQWAEQWIAHAEEFRGDEAPDECFFLALGGLRNRAAETVAIFCDEITRLHGQIGIQASAADWLDLLGALRNVNEQSSSLRRIIADIQEGLALCDIRRTEALSDLVSYAARYRGTFATSEETLRLDRGEVGVRAEQKDLALLAESNGNVLQRDLIDDWCHVAAKFRPINTKPNTFTELEPLA